jgi:formate hydrogenlyase subunit 5
LEVGTRSYPSVTSEVPAAAWYERAIHDLFGLLPLGHPRLDPLILPVAPGSPHPVPCVDHENMPIELDEGPLHGQVSGEGVFTIPYGPVRSGVFESVEYLVETTGEEIPHLRTRVHHKHRGLDARFTTLHPRDAVLLAERVEGTASVAHATAYAQAIERLCGVDVNWRAQLVRVLHAELERIAVHLDSIIRHTEGAGQAVAYARISRAKEQIQRLRAQLCGSRFGRGVVVPGGVSGPPSRDPAEVLQRASRVEGALLSDLRALMRTPSFLDRLRGTGEVPHEVAALHGAVGPIGRASGVIEDVRTARPYGAYSHLGFEPATKWSTGDALERQHVRIHEIRQSFHLIRHALGELEASREDDWCVVTPMLSGAALSWVESPNGELLYLIDVADGRINRVIARCASFHNLALLPRAFRGDIYTDFVFIEASFALSIAGVSS